MKKSLILISSFVLILSGTPALAEEDATQKVQGHGPNKSLMFEPQKDYDHDGLTNIEEDQLGLFILEKDSDYDSFSDSEERKRYGTDPTAKDTDKDGLSESVEINDFKTDPLNKDEDNDGLMDGLEERSYPIRENSENITGQVHGVGPISQQVKVEPSPIVILDYIAALKSFQLQSLNPDLTVNLTIPFESEKKDMKLFRYENTELHIVKKQKVKQNTITAEIQGGGNFVIASISEYKKSQAKGNKLRKVKKVERKEKVKVINMPGLTINPSELSEKDDVITFKKEVIKEGKKVEKKVKYKLESVVTDGYEQFATLEAVTMETGNTPTILIHGLFGSSGTWGYTNHWDNESSSPKVEQSISSTCTFTGKSYSDNTTSNYSNPDVHYICGTSDAGELGPQLDVDFGYTPNVDLFAFEYHHSGHVATGARHLGNFINALRAQGIIRKYDDVNLLAHSKGGLISRYFIENQGGTDDVERLITIGTPHFGSDLSTFGDMDRDDSDLWKSGNHDELCDTFTNRHADTEYFTIGGFDPSSGHLPSSLSGYQTVGDLSNKNYISFDTDVRETFKAHGQRLSWWSYADIEDGAVNMDSALGSDQDPDYDGTLTKLVVNNRFYVFDPSYGGHSAMRKHPDTDNYVAGILEGSWD
ncbi:hypothetical protein [Pseudalkalibacillus decolorationis]|uniref:hypothetical protein n=1 Tax=Pseudalkalibacillus decolorationis TaxID=163879 RepID=UPI0021477918|nr:hypothetical protein [Pseudalkalibacillus decolorationis]